MSRLALIILNHLTAALEGICEVAQQMIEEETRAQCKISVDPELYEEIEAYASTVNRSIDNLVEHAVRQYMRRYPRFRIEHQEPIENGK